MAMLFWPHGIKSVCQTSLSSLVQVMAYHMLGTSPLPEPMLIYCQSKPEEHILVKSWLKF